MGLRRRQSATQWSRAHCRERDLRFEKPAAPRAPHVGRAAARASRNGDQRH